mmetsp:Transcript_72107/g.233282  ORF Transcript_72107/g.233282 Transcript_72107/m.233282 type:complete len:287 (+) Transcript_72107:186-1046(+)
MLQGLWEVPQAEPVLLADVHGAKPVHGVPSLKLIHPDAERLDLQELLVDLQVVLVVFENVQQYLPLVLGVARAREGHVHAPAAAAGARARDHERARLLHEAALVGAEELPAAPDPLVDVQGVVADHQDLLCLRERPGEGRPRRVVAGAHLQRHGLRVRGLGQRRRADPEVGLHRPVAEGAVHGIHKLLEVLLPRVAHEDVHVQRLRGVHDLRVALAVLFAERLQNLRVDLVHGGAGIVLAELFHCLVAKLVQLCQRDGGPSRVLGLVVRGAQPGAEQPRQRSRLRR